MNQNNLLYYPLNGQEILAINPGEKLITYDRLNNYGMTDEEYTE